MSSANRTTQALQELSLIDTRTFEDRNVEHDETANNAANA